MILSISLFFIFILLHAICDAKMDAIKDYRTHLGKHPYGDYWHILKHLNRFVLFMAGGFVISIYIDIGWKFLFLSLLTAPFKFIWDYYYKKNPKKEYELDCNFNISTKGFLGNKLGSRVDKFLGIHW